MVLEKWFIKGLRDHVTQGAVSPYKDWPFTSRPVVADSSEAGRPVEPGEIISLTAPRVFGHPEEPSCLDGLTATNARLPPLEFQRIPGGTIIGNVAVIDGDGVLFCPNKLRPREVDFVLRRNGINADGFVLEMTDGKLMAYYYYPGHSVHYEKTAAFLWDLEAGNYGSFIFRLLPQLFTLNRVRPRFDFYVTGSRAGWLRESFDLLGLPQKPIYLTEEVIGCSFDQVLLVNDASPGGVLRKSDVGFVRDLVSSANTNGQIGRRPIYLSRSLVRATRPTYRPLLNEPQLEQLLVSKGFSPIHPETMSLRDQIRAFGNASHIIGPSGSGMLNSIFSQGNVKILDLESWTEAVRQHGRLYSSSGHQYAFCFGSFDDAKPNKSLRAWHIDMGDFERALAWMLS